MVRVYGHYLPIMLLMCITLHYTWAACVLIDPSSANATAPHILQQILPAGHIVMGVWLILVASCALFAVLYTPEKYVMWALLMPQQFTLMLSASSAILAIWLSQYSDGVVRSRGFITVDQIVIILTAFCHTISIISDVLLLHRRKLD
jgi:hypothetical protein